MVSIVEIVSTNVKNKYVRIAQDDMKGSDNCREKQIIYKRSEQKVSKLLVWPGLGL